MSRRYRSLATLCVCLATTRGSLTPSKLRPLVTWSGKEDTEVIRAACADLIPQINKLAEDGYFTVEYNGETVRVNIKV